MNKPTITDAIYALGINGGWKIKEEKIVKWWADKPQPSNEAIQAKLSELNEAYPMRVLREERNRKLAETDWRASSDLTLSSEWSTYRQALRDLPSTATPTLDDDGNLQNVTWPEEPT